MRTFEILSSRRPAERLLEAAPQSARLNSTAVDPAILEKPPPMRYASQRYREGGIR